MAATNRQIEAETTYGRFDPYFEKNVAYVGAGLVSAQYPFSNITRENLAGMVRFGDDGTVKMTGNPVGGGKLVFPEFSQGEVWRGRIRATLSGEELSVELLPFGQLVVGDQHFPLWLDQRLEVIQLPEVLESVVVQVGDKTKHILRDKPDEIWDIPMTVGQGLSLKVFEGLGQEIVISTPSARLGEFEAGQLIQVSGNQKICLGYEQKSYKCLNSDHSLITPQAGVYWLDLLENKDNYPKVTIYQPIAAYEFPAEVWQQVKTEFEIGAGEVTWQMSVEPTNVGEWKEVGGNDNCDVLKRGSAKKSVVDGGALYEATDYGAYCDSWWVGPMISEGVLRLTGENVEGRGIKLSVFSTKEDRTILEQLLPSVGKFDQSYGFLTGLQQGSTINVETKSFGRIEGKNQLDSARFYPVPLTWLQKIKIGNNEIIDNNIEIGDVKKWGTGIYRIKIQRSNDKGQMSGLLVLNQGFDKGWVGVAVPNNKLQITNYKILDHRKVNGWANGWIVETIPGLAAGATQSRDILIFYWPQVFEWLGLCVLAILFIVLALHSLRHFSKTAISRFENG